MKKLSKIFILLIFIFLSSCKTAEVDNPTPKQLVYSEDFPGSALSKMWKRGIGEGGTGKWRVENGSLNIDNAKNDPLWLNLALPEDFLIEFDAQAGSSEGDIKVEVLGDGKNHASGYILIFGGWKNKLDVIARLNEHGKDRKEQASKKAVAKRTYRFSISRVDGTLLWAIDGKPHMSFPDNNPLKGKDHSKFAFSNWAAPLRFSKLRIYKL